MPIIKFVNEKKEIQVPAGANLRTEALRAGVQLNGVLWRLATPHPVTCGACQVLITKGIENAGPKNTGERARLGMSVSYIGNEGVMRLACRTRVNGDMEVLTHPPLNLFGENFFS